MEAFKLTTRTAKAVGLATNTEIAAHLLDAAFVAYGAGSVILSILADAERIRTDITLLQLRCCLLWSAFLVQPLEIYFTKAGEVFKATITYMWRWG